MNEGRLPDAYRLGAIEDGMNESIDQINSSIHQFEDQSIGNRESSRVESDGNNFVLYNNSVKSIAKKPLKTI